MPKMFFCPAIIFFSIATINQFGILLFAGKIKSDFVEISLENGFIRARFSLGDKIFEVLYLRYQNF